LWSFKYSFICVIKTHCPNLEKLCLAMTYMSIAGTGRFSVFLLLLVKVGYKGALKFWNNIVYMTPGPGIREGRKSASGSRIREEQPGSYIFELRNHF
jgi:hypothetical protein